MTDLTANSAGEIEILTDKDDILARLKNEDSFQGFEICQVSFEDHVFEGKVDFSKAIFGEGVTFAGAQFKDKAFFDGAHFKSSVDFNGAQFDRLVFRRESES